MITLRWITSRPSTEVKFFEYPPDYVESIKRKHAFSRRIEAGTVGNPLDLNSLTLKIEMDFENEAAVKAFEEDAERAAMLLVVRAHNDKYGIKLVSHEKITK